MSRKLSFIIPIFNKAAYLDECLASVRAQTYRNIEIVCVDNNSTDDSVDIVKRHQGEDDRIRLLSEPRQGSSSARNAGLRESSGAYVLFVDGDDFVEEVLAQKVMDEVDSAHPDIIFFCYDNCYPQSDECFPGYSSPLPNNPSRPEDLGLSVFSYATPSVCTKAFRKAFIDEKGLLFDSDIKQGEDTLFSYSAIMQASIIGQIDKPALYHYRNEVEGSLTSERAERDGHSRLLLVYQKLEDMISEKGLGETFRLALLNCCIDELAYSYSLSAKSNFFIEFYRGLMDGYGARLRGLDHSSIINESLYNELIAPESLEDMLFSKSKHAEQEVRRAYGEIDALVRERGALCAERDALLRERDALCVERDALRVERDALATEIEELYASYSYKVGATLMKPLRALRKIIS